jgi:hypothetical protein
MDAPSKRAAARAIAAVAFAASACGVAEARVTRIETVSGPSPAFEGRSFGEVGPYEKIVLRAHGELDPSAPGNAVTADIALAPKNARGMVEYATEVYLLKPADLRRGNGRMFFEVLNRGNKLSLADFNNGASGTTANDPKTAADAGDGLLFRKGYSLVWAGWQSDKNVASGGGRMLATIPVARHADGSAITQRVIFEQIFDNDRTDFTLIFPAAILNTGEAELLVRNSSEGERTAVPSSAWSFLDERNVRINRADPALAKYDAGAAYELIYTAKDPDVSGVGYAITRDVASFLRHDTSPGNPLRGGIKYALAQGTSQSGRMLKGFLADGFNVDEDGRRVFEGVNVNISGAHGIELNERFGDANATGRAYRRHTTAKLDFPFGYGVITDPVTGRTDGLLARCQASSTCPKVFHTDGANEAWSKASMLVTTDGKGRPVEIPANVRVYYFASVQHGPTPQPRVGVCTQLSNPAPWEPTLRALFLTLDAWATADVAPPESRFPKTSDGTLAPALPQSAQGFPEIPGVKYTGAFNRIGVVDRSTLPPRHVAGKDYAVLVPRVDEDGNEIGGIRGTDIQVPVATHTGWALRKAGFAGGEECDLQGQFIPLAPTKAKRLEAGDPRLSLEERYRNRADYVSRVALAAEGLVRERLLLQEDADRAVAAAMARDLGLPQPAR